MAEISPLPEELCPICGDACEEFQTIRCCNRCYTSLSQTQEIIRNENFQVEPLITTTALEAASIAIASSSPEENGCTSRRRRKGLNKYYKSMNTWIDDMNELNEVSGASEIPDDPNESTPCVRRATYLSFFVNFLLLCCKISAVASSASYTIISSLCDSCLDLISGILISCIAKNSKFTREDLNLYPVGKSRVSTVGLLVFSVIMAFCALYIIIQCVQALVTKEKPVKQTTLALVMMGVTIVVKLIMCIIYYIIGHPITKTLAEDHRNDVLTNTLGIICYYGSHKFWWGLDSTGGILLSLFILISWSMNAMENAKMLLGRSAPDDVIRSLTYVAAHHHPLILQVEQVIAFQVGPGYFAELHIVVPGHIPLEASHWIGESLQLKVERIPDIERAWVHVDCETHNINEHVLFMRATGKLDAHPKDGSTNDNTSTAPSENQSEPDPSIPSPPVPTSPVQENP